MKKSLYLFIALLIATAVITPADSYAAAPTAVPTTAPSGKTGGKLDTQINQLKEKIASRVSELNLVEKRGLIGTVEEVEGNQITLRDLENKKRFVDVDELTKFSSSATVGSFGLSDLTKGKKMSVVGLYNKQSRRLLARFIRLSVDPVVITGTIAAIDKQNFVVTVKTPGNKDQKIDISTITKIYDYSAEELVKAGFSKLTAGQRLIAIGFPDKKDPSLLTTSRITFFPELPSNPGIMIESTNASAGATKSQ